MTERELLQLARNIVSGTPPAALAEVFYRTAVNRAYYAAFHRAREHLRVRENDARFASRVDVHAVVLNVLGATRSSAKERRAAQELASLRGRRRNADYELALPKINWMNEATDAVAEADEIFSLIP